MLKIDTIVAYCNEYYIISANKKTSSNGEFSPMGIQENIKRKPSDEDDYLISKMVLTPDKKNYSAVGFLSVKESDISEVEESIQEILKKLK